VSQCTESDRSPELVGRNQICQSVCETGSDASSSIESLEMQELFHPLFNALL
jgi:hypothetical protein